MWSRTDMEGAGFTDLEIHKLLIWWIYTPRENAFVTAQFLEFESC